jgi:hypothetical protein
MSIASARVGAPASVAVSAVAEEAYPLDSCDEDDEIAFGSTSSGAANDEPTTDFSISVTMKGAAGTALTGAATRLAPLAPRQLRSATTLPASIIAAAALQSAAVASSVVSHPHASRIAVRAVLHAVSQPVARLRASHSDSIRASLYAFSSDLASTCERAIAAVRMRPELAAAAAAALASSDLTRRYIAERTRRQILQNQLIDIKGNIRVFARIRPLMSNMAANASGGIETAAAAVATSAAASSAGTSTAAPALRIESDATRYIDSRSLGHLAKVYEYDEVLAQTSTQRDAYAHVAQFIPAIIRGQNLSIFAAGQTGSGTRTQENEQMEGEMKRKEGERRVRECVSSILTLALALCSMLPLLAATYPRHA